MKVEDSLKVYEAERIMEYMKWVNEIPNISFPSDYKVKIIPAFGGAVVRFRVEKNGKSVSVYLDCYDNLGCYGEPYWEVYPYDNDVFRCGMNNTKELMNAIDYSLNINK